MQASMLSIANKYAEAGLSVIPIRADGSKQPVGEWKTFQNEIAGPDELRNMFSNGAGIGIIGGRVSGNLEIIDFDEPAYYERLSESLLASGGADLLERLPLVKTPRGFHLYLRCAAAIDGNQKLAQYLDGNQKIKTAIETRGERGYVIAPGSPAACHPLNRTYEMIRGDLRNIPAITADERQFLLATARELNSYTGRQAEEHRQEKTADPTGGPPGDDFNQRATWAEILGAHGWRRISTKGDVEEWQRPEKDGGGISATTNYKSSGLLYVFSTNTIFKTERGYSKFSAYTILNHSGDFQAAARELAGRGFGEEKKQKTKADPAKSAENTGFVLYDAGEIHSWPQEPLVWLCEPLIPKGGIGFMSAPPKDRKSLLTLDLALHLTQTEARRWLGKFEVTPANVLYIAREDPLRRVQERALEICNSYQMPLPEPGRLQFLIRDRIHLTDEIHKQWLKETIRKGGFEVLVLDVINRMHPDLDEISAADMAKLVSILEELNRELGITILSDDHTRKPQGKNTGRDNQEPNPFDMKGSIAKYGCADFMICLARTPQDNRMHIYCENKDSDERPHFFVDVSPKGSSFPKFQYAGDVSRLAGDMKDVGAQNREKVFNALTEQGAWSAPKDISQRLSMSDSTVSKHLKTLFDAERIEKRGNSRNIQYRAFDREENAPRANPENSLYDND
jgi:DNA-binding transcriptional ArsR family regulator